MRSRFPTTRWFHIGALLAAGTLFQAGGCTFDTTALTATFVNSFVGLSVSTWVNGALGFGA